MNVVDREGKRLTEMSRPCRNFNILASTVMTDPFDGREKIVLSNFAAGQTGNLIFIDTETGQGESLALPGDEGAWGLVNWHNEKLIVGTCPNRAYLHSLDLRTREWAEPLRDPSEKYVWDMVLGSDDRIYGGTWPGCSLLRYDPKEHKLENLGRVSDNPKNLYSRHFHAIPGYILVSGGYDEPFLKAYHIESGTFQNFGTPGFIAREANSDFIATAKDQEWQFYDTATFERLEGTGWEEKLPRKEAVLSNGNKVRAFPLANGRWGGVRGQDYYIIDSLDEVPVLKRIPVDAPATRIHTLTVDDGGQIWGACGFGQTIFRFNPADGTYWNSSSVCNAGGEVYGMRFVGGKLFMSAYVGGDHIVYDPEQPWDQLSNANPISLKPVKPDFVRPEGRTVIGPDGGLWTGWSAKYGTYGGALSRVDPETREVQVWNNGVPEQQVAGVAADDRYVYFTTNGGASGLPFREVQGYFGVWHPDRGLIHSIQLASHEKMGNAILAAAGNVYVGVSHEIRVFDPARLEFREELAIVTEAPCSWLVSARQGRTVGAFCGKKLLLIDTENGEVEQVALPGIVRAATEHPHGIYFAVNEVLYRIAL